MRRMADMIVVVLLCNLQPSSGWAPWWRLWSDSSVLHPHQPGSPRYDVLLARWARARAAAGMPLQRPCPHRGNATEQGRECAFGGSNTGLATFVRNFYAHPFGPTAVLAGADGKCLVYRHIWKVAGTSVLAALQRAASHNHRGRAPLKYIPTTNATSRAFHCPSGRFWFTFVREPISHFLSGYEEYLMRTKARERWVNASDFLPALLDGEPRLFRQDLVEPQKFGVNDPLSHAYPQSYSIHLFRALAGGDAYFIGRLDHLARDWAEVVQCAHSLAPALASNLSSALGTEQAVSRSCHGKCSLNVYARAQRAALAERLSRNPHWRAAASILLGEDFTEGSQSASGRGLKVPGRD